MSCPRPSYESVESGSDMEKERRAWLDKPVNKTFTEQSASWACTVPERSKGPTTSAETEDPPPSDLGSPPGRTRTRS